MDLIDLIKLRQSVRKYSPRQVEPEKLNRCLEALRLAPSASNSQPWKVVVVNKEPLKTQVAQATFSNLVQFNRYTLQAPVMVVLLLNKPKLITQVAMHIKKRDWQLIDIGIAAEHFCLQAAEEGLGTCMIGWFEEKKLVRFLNIPPDKTVGLVISLGYAAEGYPLRKKIRKEINEIVSFNQC
jgi:nitroreductase